jgi:hypothetical protein
MKLMVIFAACLMVVAASTLFSEPENPSAEDGKEWKLGVNLFVAPAVTYQNITLFPLISEGLKGGVQCITMDAALEKGWLEIRELEGGESVNSLQVTNKSEKYIYLMAGEIVIGGKQDRILARDMIISPYAKKLTIDVFCVEHGRWTYQRGYGERGSSGEAKFKGAAKVTNAKVRSEAQGSKNQSKVWESVAAEQEGFGVTSSTGTYMDVVNDKEVGKRVEAYREHLTTAFEKRKNVVGVVAVINGKIATMDLFFHSSIFTQLWNKLLESYILEAAKGDKQSESRKSGIKTADVENYIKAQFDQAYRKDGDDKFGQTFRTEKGKNASFRFKHNNVDVHFNSY